MPGGLFGGCVCKLPPQLTVPPLVLLQLPFEFSVLFSETGYHYFEVAHCGFVLLQVGILAGNRVLLCPGV